MALPRLRYMPTMSPRVNPISARAKRGNPPPRVPRGVTSTDIAVQHTPVIAAAISVHMRSVSGGEASQDQVDDERASLVWRPFVAAAKVDVRPADRVEDDLRRLGRRLGQRAQAAIGDPLDDEAG